MTTSPTSTSSTIERQSKRRRMKNLQYLHQFLKPENNQDIAIVQLHKIISATTSSTPGKECQQQETIPNDDAHEVGLSNNNNNNNNNNNSTLSEINGIGNSVLEILSNNNNSKNVSQIPQIFSQSFEYQFCMNDMKSFEPSTGSSSSAAVESSTEDEEDEESDDDEEENGPKTWTEEEFSSLINSSVLLDENSSSSSSNSCSSSSNSPKNNGITIIPPKKSSSYNHHRQVCDECSMELIDETAKSISDSLNTSKNIDSSGDSTDDDDDDGTAQEKEQEQKDKEKKEKEKQSSTPLLPPPSPPLSESMTYEELIKDVNTVKSLLKSYHGVTCGFVAVGVKGINLTSIMLGIMEAGCSYYPLDYRKPVCDSYLARTVLQFNWIIADLDWVKSSDIEDEIVIAHHVFKLSSSSSSSSSTFFLIKLAEIPKDKVRLITYPRFKYAFAMRTSGTCGNRRIVLVPHQAIVINVMDFIKKFKISNQKKDVVLGLAPSTFDPCIIDLFIALGTGCKIIYVDDSIKFNCNDMMSAVAQEKCTILQCTPSYLMRFEKEHLRSTLFHPDGSLRILALGGEKCPNKSLLRQLIPKEKLSKLKIYNLYGHTELSVWATMEKINLKSRTDTDEVSLGTPLSCVDIAVFRLPTEFGFANEGEVFIGSRRKRKCVVFSEKFGSIVNPVALEGRETHYRYLQTGDYVKVQTTFINSNLKTDMYFVNRIDRIRKRNGIKIDLGNIEKIAIETGLFASADCFEHKQRILLLCRLDRIYPDNSLAIKEVYSKLYNHLKSMLYFENHPERIVIIAKDAFLNENSKLDFKRIFDQIPPLYDDKGLSMTKSFFIDSEKFADIFSNLWQSNTLSAKHPKDEDTFLSCGGSSVSGTRFVEEFFFKIQRFGSELHISNEKNLISSLLSKPLRDIKIAFYDIVKQSRYPCQFSLVDGKSVESKADQIRNYIEAPWEKNDTHTQIVKKDPNDFVARMKLPPQEYHRVQISVGLCVDATPVIAPHPVVKTICITGSHSGAVYAFSMFEGLDPFRSIVGRTRKSLVWKRLFPNRIECSMIIHPTKYLGYLGCHDGKLYCISTVTGQTEWAVNSGSSIRCSPAISPRADCVVVLTSLTALCIDALHGTILWTQLETGNFIISKSPVISETSVFFGSKGSGLSSLCVKTGALQWSSNENSGNSSFICTAPILIPANEQLDHHIVVFGDTSGRIFALDQTTGERVWKYKSSYAYKDPPSNLAYHECCLKNGPGKCIIYTTLSGFIRILNPVTGELITEVKTTEALRCVPEIVHVTDEPASSNKVVCSYFFNSKRGSMFWTFFSNGQLKKPATKIYEFGSDGAESFSSPIFFSNILTVGSRDNKAYFVEFQSLNPKSHSHSK